MSSARSKVTPSFKHPQQESSTARTLNCDRTQPRQAITASHRGSGRASQHPLRPYQASLVADIYSQWESGNRCVLAQLPTGGGKTHVFTHIAKTCCLDGKRVLVVAHREELITQAGGKLSTATGEPVGIIKAGFPFEPKRQIQVASIQTLVNRLDEVGDFDLVVIDECHRSIAASYRAILGHYPNALQLGVSATPVRSDGSGFDDVFDSLVCGPTVRELIELGHLCRYRLIADAQQMTTKGVKTTAGEYNQKQLAEVNDAVQLAGSIVGSYLGHCQGKKAIVFALNCEHSRAIAAAYNAAGIPALHLDGNSTPDERKAGLATFAAGDIQVLCNVGLFTEGFDLPAIEVVQIARPTKSVSLWLQMLGRGLRTAPGKTEALLLDHTDNWQRLGTPTRPRIWTLDGLEVEPRETVRKANGEVEEVEPVVIEESPAILQEVEVDPLEEWFDAWSEMVEMQQQRGYKPGWLTYKLQELKPPLEVWQEAAKHLKYRPGWAWHQFNSSASGAEVAA